MGEFGELTQLVECNLCKVEVRSSSLLFSIDCAIINIDVQEDKNSDASDSGSTPLISIARGCQGFDGV